MPVLEVRRHAERAVVAGGSALSENGRRVAASLAGVPYALVVASPLPRAQETARLIGGRLDGTDPALLPDIGGAGVFGQVTLLARWAELARERAEVRTFADEQLAAWTAIAARAGGGERALAVSHGGIVDVPAVVLALRLGLPVEGPSFGYCEGVRVTFENGAPVALEVLRVRS